MSVRARHSSRPILLRLVVAFVVALAPTSDVGAQSAGAPTLRTLAGTWYLVSKPPAYDTTRAPRTGPDLPIAQQPLVPVDQIRWAPGPFPVPPRASDAYPLWVETNPRDSIAFAVEDSTVTIFADGASAMWWTVDGLARQEAVGTALYRTRAEWKKDALVLERGRVTGRDTQRRFRLLKDGRLELTFPGIRRHPDYPGKYLFERVRPAAKP